MSQGEGSRGGKVIGHTRGGRAVYASDALAKAAGGHDPHPGARDFAHQGVGGGHVLPGGGLGSSYSLSPHQKAEAAGRDAYKTKSAAAASAAQHAAKQERLTSMAGADAHRAAAGAHREAAVAASNANDPEKARHHMGEAEAHDDKANRLHQDHLSGRNPIPPRAAASPDKKLRLRGNLDRPATLNQMGYTGGRARSASAVKASNERYSKMLADARSDGPVGGKK